MRLWSVFRRSMLLQLRDYWALLLTLVSAPFFVAVYWMITSSTAATAKVAWVDLDTPAPQLSATLDSAPQNPAPLDGEAELRAYATALRLQNGALALALQPLPDRATADLRVSNRDADLVLLIPPGFSDSLAHGGQPQVELRGDLGNPRYALSSILAITAVDGYVRTKTGARNAYDFRETFLGNSGTRTDFELAIPGQVAFSLIMLLFTAGMIFIRDIEDRTLQRLVLTRMSALDYIVGIGSTQILTGIASVGLTLLTASAFGYRFEGSLAALAALSMVTLAGIIGVSLVVASLCARTFLFLTAGNIPLFLLMFLTGAMFPLARNPFVEFAGIGIAWNDLLPPTLAVVALQKVMTQGAGLAQIVPHLIALTLVAALWLIGGTLLFRRMHLRTH